MPIVRSFIYLHTAEGRIFQENQEKEVARIVAAPPVSSIGNYEFLGLQIKNSQICGIYNGKTGTPASIRFDPRTDRPIAFGGHIFALGEDCTKKRTGNPDLDDFLDYIREQLATETAVPA